MKAIKSIDHKLHSATIRTEAQWFNIEQLLNNNHLRLPVLPDYLYLSVVGTLSVGGIGRTSHKFGTQVDQIKRLTLINFEGKKILVAKNKTLIYFTKVH